LKSGCLSHSPLLFHVSSFPNLNFPIMIAKKCCSGDIKFYTFVTGCRRSAAQLRRTVGCRASMCKQVAPALTASTASLGIGVSIGATAVHVQLAAGASKAISGAASCLQGCNSGTGTWAAVGQSLPAIWHLVHKQAGPCAASYNHFFQ
jgi:hypothetical protein